MTVTSAPRDNSISGFDPASGSFIERLLFGHRLAIVLICAAITLLLTWQASGLRLNASFEKTIPVRHPYIQNFLAHQDQPQVADR